MKKPLRTLIATVIVAATTSTALPANAAPVNSLLAAETTTAPSNSDNEPRCIFDNKNDFHSPEIKKRIAALRTYMQQLASSPESEKIAKLMPAFANLAALAKSKSPGAQNVFLDQVLEVFNSQEIVQLRDKYAGTELGDDPATILFGYYGFILGGAGAYHAGDDSAFVALLNMFFGAGIYKSCPIQPFTPEQEQLFNEHIDSYIQIFKDVDRQLNPTTFNDAAYDTPRQVVELVPATPKEKYDAVFKEDAIYFKKTYPEYFSDIDTSGSGVKAMYDIGERGIEIANKVIETARKEPLSVLEQQQVAELEQAIQNLKDVMRKVKVVLMKSGFTEAEIDAELNSAMAEVKLAFAELHDKTAALQATENPDDTAGTSGTTDAPATPTENKDAQDQDSQPAAESPAPAQKDSDGKNKWLLPVIIIAILAALGAVAATMMPGMMPPAGR